MLAGFKEYFVPMIWDGSKTHTIRGDRRDGRLPKPGERIYMYCGLRTKNSFKIGEAICQVVYRIQIEEHCIIIVGHSGVILTMTGYLADRFAWQDGFRPEGSMLEKPTNCFKMMISYWKKSLHKGESLPWKGNIIYWEKFTKAEQTIIKKIKS